MLLQIKTRMLSDFHFLAIAVLAYSLIACGGGGVSGPEFPEPPPPFWQTATPDFSTNPDRPVITLSGPKTIILSVGETFQDPGASAQDVQDGDLTSEIVTDTLLDTNIAADFLVRYQVTDSSGLHAIEAVRIVRVIEDEPHQLTGRSVGTSGSHWGYIEHLPLDYGEDPDQQYPLLIFNHGNGANAAFIGGTPDNALGGLISNSGPALLLWSDNWNNDLPFIVLMPQVGSPGYGDPMDLLVAFVEYAKTVYAIDESRIYMTGWSQGGFLSLGYAATKPEKIAAALSISGGIPEPEFLPSGLCGIESVPIWAMHGDADIIVPVTSSIDTVDQINQECNPIVAPKLTVFLEQRHSIHHAIFSLHMMEGGSIGVSADSAYDIYDQSLYDWLLSHQKALP